MYTSALQTSLAGGLITAVAPHSLAADLGLSPGDHLVAVDDQPLRDVIDYRFAIAEAQVRLLVRHADGTQQTYQLTKDPDAELGIEFAEPLFDRLRTCTNKCPFCFLTQMPKGFRKTLYVKDDDYRLSFLYHNFVTFTNLREADWQRIAEQRLSPLHISVHATDPFWRSVMLGKPDLPDVREQIQRLGALGIEVHTQIVVCPQANDGAVLRQSIADLIALAPIVQSIAVVPVGLTKLRFNGERPSTIQAAIAVHANEPSLGFCSRLGAAANVPLRCFTPNEAAEVVDLIEEFGATCRKQLRKTFVYPSDEFFLLAGRPLPPARYYDQMPQYSNGVGMVRDFLDTWRRLQRRLPPKLKQPTRLALVCGTLVAPLLNTIVPRLNRIAGLEAQVVPVINQFFGDTVTVSGLLTAQDVIPALRASGATHALLPRVMFDYQGVTTLDDYSCEQIATAVGMPIALAGDPDELIHYLRGCLKSP
ncbi:DUF512 domain-containing protein [Candidatus Viridilinea mediisalina]|uniref:PDZ domain-containing protein n=1 Tax=Candidatus Viridilinea mediisalina TaxID=2024553 RepID=A0A2A6RKN4_9CHLR|nr:DUF512 domain-containing protein [Candidatus Viridilinea mediisalina]PDW03446.1 hypothetical protein CJ255_08560 [Candidatus Viridilinea mediisalina]